ncbi:MAG: thioesterase family protein [Bacteroides sp.]|nr:thioesterase family protein [Bacteroides sp.]MCM1084894.1 thioesterase family protein [Bacteroides sp.]MCM1168356.1 thioesterase family protein [Bacteroides sp.]
MKEIQQGLTATVHKTVEPQDLACVHGSGSLEVYATPAMAALMERTACVLLEPYMEQGETTVGVALDLKHLKADLCGMKLSCTATLAGVEGRKTVFDIEVRDALSVVGTARHERFSVMAEPFMQKAEENRKKCELE